VADSRKGTCHPVFIVDKNLARYGNPNFLRAAQLQWPNSIFKSSLVTCNVSEDIKSFTRQLLTKAKQYSDCRNVFAHDQPLLRQFGTPAQFEILLVDGKGQFQSDEEKKRYIDLATTVPDIAEIAVNFRHLGTLIEDFWSQLATRSASLHKLRERLAALPNPRRPKDRSQPAVQL
jgi:hypothetical protein